jgi:hypothetical protein
MIETKNKYTPLHLSYNPNKLGKSELEKYRKRVRI